MLGTAIGPVRPVCGSSGSLLCITCCRVEYLHAGIISGQCQVADWTALPLPLRPPHLPPPPMMLQQQQLLPQQGLLSSLLPPQRLPPQYPPPNSAFGVFPQIPLEPYHGGADCTSVCCWKLCPADHGSELCIVYR